ncbi:receptor-like protein 12 [Chenopodium quinoa]|uniref:receptor-like protein 12 n=1 Tax=Chenopodium quinoa TaxID=63459 RepID=UPI000B76C986|nr:receptor-like protein 12 [Chenopodium quinoa]
MGAEVGFPVGIAVFLGPLLYIKRYRECCHHTQYFVLSQCLDNEKSILLEFKDNFRFSSPDASAKLKIWNQSTDCCQWSGVECDSDSRVASLDLSREQITGSIGNSSSLFRLQHLQVLDLSSNHIEGSIPSSIDSRKLLVNESTSTTSCRLSDMNLSNNNFDGPIPMWIFQQCKYLLRLDLSLNRFDGTLKLDPLNQISNIGPKYPGLDFRHVHWNFSCNRLVELEPPLPISNLTDYGHNIYIDLHSNNFQGKFPPLPFKIANLDCSNNNFTSIDPDFGIYLSRTFFLSFSNNSLYGSIPTALCNTTSLRLINLEYNYLDGTIPDCLGFLYFLTVLNLKGNNLRGVIPANFGDNVRYLQTLDLNGNFFQGRVPRSLANIEGLRVLDLGNNRFNDVFPCHLKRLPNLQVLILRSNEFYGTVGCRKVNHSIWPMLQIMDLAVNNFRGELRAKHLFNWRSMMVGTSDQQLQQGRLISDVAPGSCVNVNQRYYQNTATVTLKGNTYELQYILTIFSIIDFSNNLLHGELPVELGNLNGLVVLNLSHNSFSGKIPPSIGNLSQIQSLDLSCNIFSERIPTQLANLNFLGYLNLSYNKLSGKIPTSTQLQSFDASSYEGNQGLYGPPLAPFNGNEVDPRTNSQGSDWSSKSVLEWMLMGAEVGFPVGITVILGPLLYIRRYREWYCSYLHILVMKILCKEGYARRRRRVRQQRRRR